MQGAFSGLLAGVITEHLSFARGLEGWRWLLLIEGAASSFVGLFAWIFLPDWPSTTSWLTAEERVRGCSVQLVIGLTSDSHWAQFIAIQRLTYDGIGGTQDATLQVSRMLL